MAMQANPVRIHCTKDFMSYLAPGRNSIGSQNSPIEGRAGLGIGQNSTGTQEGHILTRSVSEG